MTMPLDDALGGKLSQAKPAGGREAVVAFWVSRGAPQHVAEGIADSVNRESRYKADAWNPNDKGSPSGGLYQHHADRLAHLQAYAAVKGEDWRQANLQHEYAYREVTGADPTAAKHWQDILSAPDRKTAQARWDKYFERGAGMTGSGERRMPGRLGGMGPRGSKTEPPDDQPPDEERKEIDRLKVKFARMAASAAPTTEPEAKPAEQPKPAEDRPQAAQQPAAQRFQVPPPAQVRPPAAAAPVSLPAPPPLAESYRNALGSVLAGRRRPFASIFG